MQADRAAKQVVFDVVHGDRTAKVLGTVLGEAEQWIPK